MIQAPKGTRDVYGTEMLVWHRIEEVVRSITHSYNFAEIRTPIIESADLFLRGVGDTTDIVQKEMYTFTDKGGRNISLRPELTAGVARAYMERGLHNQPQPTKLWYIGQNFRYENPETGRYRQHYQFGVEVFGSNSYVAEAEIIALGWHLLAKLGIKDVTVNINSIGCTICRKVYHQNLRQFIDKAMDKLCSLCRSRAEKNPLRILDCKTPTCKELLVDAPLVLDALDDDCRSHFEGLTKMLTTLAIPYVINPRVVRGLDYYTRTVFEFIGGDGLTILGGGRYDGLITELGGPFTPAVGFGMGMERLVILLQKQQEAQETQQPDIFIGHAEEAGFVKAQELANALRQQPGLAVETDLAGRSVKAQMKFADKIKAKHTIILGGNEIATGLAQLKNMATGEAVEVRLAADVLAGALV